MAETPQDGSAQATVASFSGHELRVQMTETSTAKLLSWLAQNKELTKGGISIDFNDNYIQLRFYSGTLADLNAAANFINRQQN